MKPFQIGDEVALSATFLRSLGTLSFGGGASGPTTHDAGIGKIVEFPCDPLAVVQFPGGRRTLNVGNLVHRADIHLEASHAEHAQVGKRFYKSDLFGELRPSERTRRQP